MLFQRIGTAGTVMCRPLLTFVSGRASVVAPAGARVCGRQIDPDRSDGPSETDEGVPPVKTYIDLSCPNCQRLLRVRTEYAGKRIACKHCSHAFVAGVPADAGPPQPDPAA